MIFLWSLSLVCDLCGIGAVLPAGTDRSADVAAALEQNGWWHRPDDGVEHVCPACALRQRARAATS